MQRVKYILKQLLMHLRRGWVLIAVVAVITCCMSFSAGYYFEISKNVDILASLYKDVNTYYVDDIEPSKLMRNCIDGMLKQLDPFTNYFSESQVEDAKIQMGGKFGGLGLEVDIMNSWPVVTSITKDEPADKSGLHTGDVIMNIDGKSMQNRAKEDIDKLLVGEPKTMLSLQIARKTMASDTLINFTVQREEIEETNLPFWGMVSPDVACIKLKIFNEHAAKDVRNALDSMKRANPDLKGVILDLRGNPGGLLSEGVGVVNTFIPKNELVVSTKGKVAEWNNTFKTLDEPVDTKIPLVLIVNSSSASASEIVSGTVQDYDRGVIIGQKTYGKGLVQIVRQLSYNTALKVTTAKYYIATGRCIQAINYAERNADGSVKHIPDSLKVAFKTINKGRTVYDGGGVDPDLILPKVEHSKLAETLFLKGYVFDFASRYKLQHAGIGDPSQFKLTNQDFNDFVAYVKTKDLSYKTATEAKLEELKDATTEEKYFDAVKAQYDEIEKKVQQDKEQALVKNKKEIVIILENEIAGRYYYAYGKVKKSYENDPEVAKAIELLHNPQQYNDLLEAKK
jgi:carboxyl-terminal processing protease